MKYLLIVFSLLLLTSCGETEAEAKKRKHLERIENAKTNTTPTNTTPTKTKSKVGVTTKVGTTTLTTSVELDEPIIIKNLKKSDFYWDGDTDNYNSKGALIINDIFTLRAKTHSDNIDIVYSLFRDGKYTGNWALHSEFVEHEDPMTEIINHVFKYYNRDHVNLPEAFKFD